MEKENLTADMRLIVLLCPARNEIPHGKAIPLNGTVVCKKDYKELYELIKKEKILISEKDWFEKEMTGCYAEVDTNHFRVPAMQDKYIKVFDPAHLLQNRASAIVRHTHFTVNAMSHNLANPKVVSNEWKEWTGSTHYHFNDVKFDTNPPFPTPNPNNLTQSAELATHAIRYNFWVTTSTVKKPIGCIFPMPTNPGVQRFAKGNAILCDGSSIKSVDYPKLIKFVTTYNCPIATNKQQRDHDHNYGMFAHTADGLTLPTINSYVRSSNGHVVGHDYDGTVMQHGHRNFFNLEKYNWDPVKEPHFPKTQYSAPGQAWHYFRKLTPSGKPNCGTYHTAPYVAPQSINYPWFMVYK